MIILHTKINIVVFLDNIGLQSWNKFVLLYLSSMCLIVIAKFLYMHTSLMEKTIKNKKGHTTCMCENGVAQ